MGDVIPLRTGLAAVEVSSRLRTARLRSLQAQLAADAQRAESRIRADADLREAFAIYERLERHYCSPKTTPTAPKPRSKPKPSPKRRK